MAKRVARASGLISPYLQHKEGLLHKENPGFYEDIKKYYWGYVTALKKYAYRMYHADKSAFPSVFFIEVNGNEEYFEMSLKRTPPCSWSDTANKNPNSDTFNEIVSFSFGPDHRDEPLFSISWPDEARTFSVALSKLVDYKMVQCAARMLADTNRKNLARKDAMSKVLKDLCLLN